MADKKASHTNNFQQSNLASGEALQHKTLNLQQAADFLRLNKETLRRHVIQRKIPGAKVANQWIFLEADLVEYLRSLYSSGVASQGVIIRSNKQWHYKSEVKSGGFASATMAEGYNEALGLTTK